MNLSFPDQVLRNILGVVRAGNVPGQPCGAESKQRAFLFLGLAGPRRRGAGIARAWVPFPRPLLRGRVRGKCAGPLF